mmetsp:Transcript_29944/g.70431  ORF Transcript_29944/g.70431 Transcript_29944/m.70431 type:complete len:328 (+) Transcript_29944:190-1173(+)
MGCRNRHAQQRRREERHGSANLSGERSRGRERCDLGSHSMDRFVAPHQNTQNETCRSEHQNPDGNLGLGADLALVVDLEDGGEGADGVGDVVGAMAKRDNGSREHQQRAEHPLRTLETGPAYGFRVAGVKVFCATGGAQCILSLDCAVVCLGALSLPHAEIGEIVTQTLDKQLGIRLSIPSGDFQPGHVLCLGVTLTRGATPHRPFTRLLLLLVFTPTPLGLPAVCLGFDHRTWLPHLALHRPHPDKRLECSRQVHRQRFFLEVQSIAVGGVERHKGQPHTVGGLVVDREDGGAHDRWVDFEGAGRGWEIRHLDVLGGRLGLAALEL